MIKKIWQQICILQGTQDLDQLENARNSRGEDWNITILHSYSTFTNNGLEMDLSMYYSGSSKQTIQARMMFTQGNTDKYTVYGQG